MVFGREGFGGKFGGKFERGELFGVEKRVGRGIILKELRRLGRMRRDGLWLRIQGNCRLKIVRMEWS